MLVGNITTVGKVKIKIKTLFGIPFQQGKIHDKLPIFLFDNVLKYLEILVS
jgi:hypothetical protein